MKILTKAPQVLSNKRNSKKSEKFRAYKPQKRSKHVEKACVHCKKAHLGCDHSRPCKRCIHLGKEDCVDVEHKKRGRPRTGKKPRKGDVNLVIYSASGLEYHHAQAAPAAE
jgi:hypothetical protein